MEHSVNHRNMKKVLDSEYIFKVELTCFLMNWNREREREVLWIPCSVLCRETLILYSKAVHYINTFEKIF